MFQLSSVVLFFRSATCSLIRVLFWKQNTYRINWTNWANPYDPKTVQVLLRGKTDPEDRHRGRCLLCWTLVMRRCLDWWSWCSQGLHILRLHNRHLERPYTRPSNCWEHSERKVHHRDCRSWLRCRRSVTEEHGCESWCYIIAVYLVKFHRWQSHMAWIVAWKKRRRTRWGFQSSWLGQSWLLEESPTLHHRFPSLVLQKDC